MMDTCAGEAHTSPMPHATKSALPAPRPSIDAARKPLPIQTAHSQDSTFGPERNASDAYLPERPPISPITPTEDAPPSPSQDHLHLQTAPPSLDGLSDSRPLSRTSFTFTASTQASTPPRPPSPHSISLGMRAAGSDSNSTTPPRPTSFSPPPSHIMPHAAPTATFVPQPPSQHFDESSNTDVAALKACISVLQLQQAKSRRDIASLQRIKEAASTDPIGFTSQLQSGRLNDDSSGHDALSATFAGAEDEPDDDDDGSSGGSGGSGNGRGGLRAQSKFGTIPQPQNVVRCPPINWSKYHLVGEPLDRMHEEQRRRPDPGEPWREGGRDATIFAPYSPFKDHIGQQQQGMVTRKGGKRPAKCDV